MANEQKSTSFAVNGTLAGLVALALFAFWHYGIAPSFNRPNGYETYAAEHARAQKWFDDYGQTYWRREAEQGLAGSRSLDSIEDPQLRLAVQALRAFPHTAGVSWADETKLVRAQIEPSSVQPAGLQPYIRSGRYGTLIKPCLDFVNDAERFSALRQGTFLDDQTVSVREVPADIVAAWNLTAPADEKPARPFRLYLIGWMVYALAFFLAFLGLDRTQEMVRIDGIRIAAEKKYADDKKRAENEGKNFIYVPPVIEPRRFADSIRPTNVYEGILWFTASPAFLAYAALARDLRSLPFRKKTEAEKLDEALALARRMLQEATDPDVRKRCADALIVLERSRVRVAFEPIRGRLESLDALAGQELGLEEIERELGPSTKNTTDMPPRT